MISLSGVKAVLGGETVRNPSRPIAINAVFVHKHVFHFVATQASKFWTF